MAKKYIVTLTEEDRIIIAYKNAEVNYPYAALWDVGIKASWASAAI